MGYPMSFRRFINRNRLWRGDYQDSGEHPIGVSIDPKAKYSITEDEWRIAQSQYMIERIQQYDAATRMILGDLRRLEKDSVDENAICKHIEWKTGINADIVAAVIKEFMDF